MRPQLARTVLAAFCFSIPLDAIPVEGIGSIALVTGVLLVPAALLSVLGRGRLRRLTSEHAALVGFAAWAGASTLWAEEFDPSLQRATTFGQLLVFLLIAWQLVRTEGHVRGLLWAYLGGSTIAAIGAFVNASRGVLTTETAVRFTATGFNENDLGVTLVLGIPMAWYLAAGATSWPRLLAYAYVPLALLGTLLTGSRGAALAVVPALLIVPALIRGGSRMWFGTMAVGAAAASVVVVAVPEAIWERMSTIGSELSGGTLTHRTTIWAAGLQVWADHWAAGVGAGMYGYSVERILNWNIVAHNTPLSIGVELGLIGLALFAWPFLAVAKRARTAPLHTRRFVWVLLATWLVGASSLSWEYRKATWFVLATTVALVYATGRPNSAERGSAQRPLPEQGS